MKKALFIAILFSISLSTSAQISYEERLEFERNDGYTKEEITAFGKSGLILSSKNTETEGGENEWKYELYDRNLDLVETKNVLLDKKFSEAETTFNKDRMHSLYKDRKGNFAIVSVEAETMNLVKIEGELPKKSIVGEMVVLGDFVILELSMKSTPVLLKINWRTGEKRFVPLNIPNIKPKNMTIMHLQVLEEDKEIFAYIKAFTSKKRSDIFVLRLNYFGEKEALFNLTENVEENLVDVSASKLGDGLYAFSGTYSEKFTGISQGLFFCQADGSKLDFIKFYSFTDMENFFSYLPERKQEKIEKKKDRKQKKGKELTINYRIAAHDVIQIEDGYLFIGEAYYPTYRTEYYTTTTYTNGVARTVTHTRQVFDGYQYTHAVVSKFAKDGTLLWDEIFEMWPSYKPFYEKRFISIAEQNQASVKLVFASRNRITAKEINFDGEVIADEQSEEIETNISGDKTKYSFSNIDYWYDNYYIAYGFQTIKNKEAEDKSLRKRKVFFLSKIAYE
jgi:hypothetical protein